MKIIPSIIASMMLLALAGAASATPNHPPQVRPPASITALGDSITVGFNTCDELVCLENSWATGKNLPASLYKRLDARTKKDVVRDNYAQFGSKMSDLPGQATLAMQAPPELVTILSGANDMCGYTLESATNTNVMRDSLKETFDIIHETSPETRIYVLSIPDIPRLISLNKDNPEAKTFWQENNICNSLLNTEGMEQAQAMRTTQWRISMANQMIQELCATEPNCWTDGGAVNRTQFTTEEVSSKDFFHPSEAGQQKLADVAWEAFPYQQAGFTVKFQSLKGDPEAAPTIDILQPSTRSSVNGEVTLLAEVHALKEGAELEKVYLKTPLGNFPLIQQFTERSLPLVQGADADADAGATVDAPQRLPGALWGVTADSTLVPDGTKVAVTVVAVDSDGNVSESEVIRLVVRNDVSAPAQEQQEPQPTS